MAKQYADAGGILDKMLTGGGAMKTLLYGSGNHQAQIPMIHALVCETLKCTCITLFNLNCCIKQLISHRQESSGHCTLPVRYPGH